MTAKHDQEYPSQVSQPFFTLKIALHLWGSGPHLTYGSFGPPKSIPYLKQHLDQFSPSLQGSWSLQTDRQIMLFHL